MTVKKEGSPNSCQKNMRKLQFCQFFIFACCASAQWRRLVFTAVLASACGAFGQRERNATMPVPEGAKVMLQTDRSEYFLGENVMMRFVLENTSEKSFEAEFGGDYRGSTRSLRFIVTATDKSGETAPDPDSVKMNFGGMVGYKTIDSHASLTNSLLLMRYCWIDKPGRYTIRATHDFGWKEDEQRKRPAGEITLTFRMPTPDEAEAVVAAAEKLPEPNPYFSDGNAPPDFRLLRQQVYFKPLLRRAEKGNAKALDGIGGMATREATEALVSLSTNAASPLAKTAVSHLWERLPNSAARWSVFQNVPPFTEESRQQRIEQSWDETLAPAVRQMARVLLERKDVDDITTGARIMCAIGTRADADSVLAAMNRALNPLVNPRTDPRGNTLDLPQPLRELLGAMNAIRSRGEYALPEHLGGEAQFLLYFTWLKNSPLPRPPRWQNTLDAFGGGNKYPTRIAALESIPIPIPDACMKFVMERLNDKDIGVCRVACDVAGASGDAVFIKPLLEIIATEHDRWLLGQASEALKKLGSRYDLFEAWADRLNEDEEVGSLARSALQELAVGKAGSTIMRTALSREERLALRREWKKFLEEHADEIRQGDTISLDNPAITPALLGPETQMYFPDGKVWPPAEK